MAPILTPALAALRAGFNARFPNRDKASDGWIGDPAHQLRRSGHNPDDTPGSLPEYEDADSIAEVRALDVDHDLRDPAGVTMSQVIAAILARPEDRARLRYVIYRGRIASRNNGWTWATYTGDAAHDTWAHFSGDPNTDNDDRPWAVATLGDDMQLDADDRKWLLDNLGPRATWGHTIGSEELGITWAAHAWLKRGQVAVASIAAGRAELAAAMGRDVTDEAAIVSGVLAGLASLDLDAAAAALRAAFGDRADDLAARLTS